MSKMVENTYLVSLGRAEIKKSLPSLPVIARFFSRELFRSSAMTKRADAMRSRRLGWSST